MANLELEETLDIPEGKSLNETLLSTLEAQGVKISIDNTRRAVTLTWREGTPAEHVIQDLREELGITQKIPEKYKSVTITLPDGISFSKEERLTFVVHFYAGYNSPEKSGNVIKLTNIPEDKRAMCSVFLRKLQVKYPGTTFEFEE